MDMLSLSDSAQSTASQWQNAARAARAEAARRGEQEVDALGCLDL